MYVCGESDEVIVVMKRSNKDDLKDRKSAENVERRTSVKGNPVQVEATVIQSTDPMLSGLNRVREKAKKDRTLKFTNLMHHITPALLESSYNSIRRNGAVGLDGQSWKEYGKDGLKGKLEDLCERIQSGRFRATPSKRIWIPKANGEKRPIAIPILEDKIVQQTLVWLLQSVFEENFVGFSYGFRPKRSGHNALDAVYMAITTQKVSWVLDADIEKFFDRVNHDKLIECIQNRITDPRILKLVRRFLTAGVSEEGQWSRSRVGTPQGGVLSPMLANIYLHYAFDQWILNWRKTRARGAAYVVRYADDTVLCFQFKDDAVRCLEELRERLLEFDLNVHPDKTRLIEFGRFAEGNRKSRGQGKPETFDFLGFTHICGKRRKDGKFTVIRKTISKRLSKKVKEIRRQLFRNRHRCVREMGKWLRAVIQGHLNYFAVPGNLYACNQLRTEVIRAWINALRKRSQKGRKFNWSRFRALIARWMPKVRVLHPYPNQRLIV